MLHPIRRVVRFVRGKTAGFPLTRAISRHQYKDVWTELSTTEDSAKFWVQGSTSEAQLAETAANDVSRFARGGLHITDADDVLEIGCGVGRVGSVLAPMCRTWTGADVSPHMLAHARRRLQAFSNVRFVEVSGYDLRPIPDHSFDVVYCTVVFMHLSEWDRYSYILEARRVLRPGGRLHVDNMALNTQTGWEFFERSRAFPPGGRPPQIGSVSTPQEFEVYLSRAGFTTYRVHVVDEAWVVGLATK